MGLETRQRGGVYYYRKRRIGGRVVSEYLGAGDLALLANAYAQREKNRREAARIREKEEQRNAAAMDEGLTDLSYLIDVLVSAFLHNEGYHQHKGQWRRKRDKTNNEEATS